MLGSMIGQKDSAVGVPRETWVICRVARKDLVYARNILDAYEGVCVPTTLPGGEGRLRLLTSSDRKLELSEVLDALAGECGLTVEGWGEGPQ